jgi:hypothetical protein
MSRFIDTQKIRITPQNNISIVKYSRSEKRYIRHRDEFYKAKRIEAKKRRKRNRKFRDSFTLPPELWQIILEYVLYFTDRFPIFRAISKHSQIIIDSYLLRFKLNDKELMKYLIPCRICKSYSLLDICGTCVNGCLCICQNNDCPRYLKVITSSFPEYPCGKCKKYTLDRTYYVKNNYLKKIEEDRKRLYNKYNNEYYYLHNQLLNEYYNDSSSSSDEFYSIYDGYY